MAQNVYECMVILDPNKYAQDPNAVGGQIPALVERFGGELLFSRLWNEQKMAYPIDGHKKGIYWLTYFRMDSLKLIEFNREIRINESLLRSLTLKVDPRLVDDLLAHARGERKARPIEESAPAVETPPVEGLAFEVPEEASV